MISREGKKKLKKKKSWGENPWKFEKMHLKI
jgi:hypothetical protein